MKGIKKLFYGLVFMALFGVAFKVEAKAAATFGYSMTGGPGDFSSFKGNIHIGDDAFPNITNALVLNGTVEATYTWSLSETNKPIADIRTGKVVLKTVRTDGVDEHFINSEKKTTADINLFDYNMDGIREMNFKETSAGVKKGQFQLSATKSVDTALAAADYTVPDIAALNCPTEFVLGQVTGGVYCGTKIDAIKCNNTAITTANPVYLFSGEEKNFTADVPGSPYQYKTWTKTGAGVELSNIAEGTVKLTMPNPAVAVELREVYGSLVFTPDINANTTVASGTKSDEVTYTATEYVIPDDVDGVYLDGGTKSVAPTWTAGKFTFTVPAGTLEGLHYFTVVMADGSKFKHEFTVDNDDPVELDAVIYVTEGFDVLLSNYISDGSDTKAVRATITGDAKSYASLKPTTAGTKSTNIGAIYVHGDSATKDTEAKTGKKHLKLMNAAGTEEYDTANITVFPKPVVTVNPSGSSSSSSSLNSTTSSSSSSTETPLRIDLPTGVYHGTRKWTDVKRATVIFSVSGKDIEKTLDMTTTDSSNKLIKYANVNSMALSSVLKDLCGSESSKEVTVRAYPNDGSGYDPDVYGEAKFTAYKVTLDTTGGAKYTVNGTEISDGYFYGVDGTTYTIKSTATNGGTLDKTNSGDFNSGESISLKVLGARTLKAVYESKSNKSGGTAGDTTGMDDYDDVPKTGESKTDIWILWSVLLVSILGAGFMIWKRFGLVHAIAEAEEEIAVAEHEEKVEAEAKEKENKLNMLKDLRNL